jgi:5-methyltetrahydrofolate--homocysteine methyltransferase
VFDKMTEAILEGDEELVAGLVAKALKMGEKPEDILDQGLVAAMNVVGRLFKDGEMFVPEVLMSANAMQAGNNLLKPLMVGEAKKTKGKVVIGTVAGDLHDIGKKIVGMMLEGAGYEVMDLGIDVSTERFIGAVRETNADIIAMSAMLTTTMTAMDEVIQEMKKDSTFDCVKIMVGGAPLSDDYAKKIGANFSYDAASAVELANRLMP